MGYNNYIDQYHKIRKSRNKMRSDLSRIHGIVVPMITPLKADQSIDEPALHKILNHLLEAGVHGIFVNSTTGEGLCLSEIDRRKVLKVTVDKMAGCIPVYAGISDISTHRTIYNLKVAENMGADIAVVHPPFYYPANSQQELYTHFAQIAKHATIPVMLYNIPLMTRAPIALETIRRLLKFEQIIGIKDSSNDLAFLHNLIGVKQLRPDFKVFIGKSHLWAAGMLSGADGGLDGISNLIPQHCVRLYNEIQAGSKQVFTLQREINEIWRIYECRSFLGGLKAAMHLLGLCEPVTASPILPASKKEMKKIKQILLDKGILNRK